MNILILNYEYPPLGGGAGIVTQHLSEEFIAQNHKVTILTTWFAGVPEYHAEDNLTIIRLKSKRKKTYESNPLEMFSWMRQSIKYFKKHPKEITFDICLANFTMPGGEVARFLKKKFKIPYIILSHGHDIPWAYPKMMFWWHLFFYNRIKKICLDSERNILLSNEIKQFADKFLGEKYENKNLVFYNGLHMHHFNKRFEGEVLKIVFVGRLVVQKSPFVFLEAIKILQKYKIPFEVNFIGDGELNTKMIDFVASNNLNNISFNGKVSHAEVLNMLSNSHLLVSTSESEGMSLAILEAISSGIYVIATDVSGNRNIIAEDLNGNIVPCNQPLMVADKMLDFYNNKLLKKYTFNDNYIELMNNLFSWDKIAKQYEDLFKEII